jgi:hypothetical protein
MFILDTTSMLVISIIEYHLNYDFTFPTPPTPDIVEVYTSYLAILYKIIKNSQFLPQQQGRGVTLVMPTKSD